MTTDTPLGDFLTNLAAELGALVIAAWTRRTKEQIYGTPREQAVRRCLDAGLVVFLRRVEAEAPTYADLMATTDTFFRRPDVAKEITRLLRGRRLDVAELQYLFEEAGYPHEGLFDFPAAMTDFQGIFLLQAADEDALRDTVQAVQLLQQTDLLDAHLRVLEEIRDILRQTALADITGIAAEQITAHNVVSGTQVFQIVAGPGPARFPPHWETHYLDALVHQCDRLDLTPLAAGEATADPLSIAQVFTTLYLEGATRAEDETVAEALAPAATKERAEVMAQGKERVPITATEAIAAVPHLVILGRPGGGKSTLVNHVAAQLARRRTGETETVLPGWPDDHAPLPVRVVLRRFAEWLAAEGREGTAGDVWDYLASLLASWGCADSFDGLRHTLIEEGGIVFFDGLDEIREASARRAIIKGAVTDFAATEKQCQVVVTSRPYAYTAQADWRLPQAVYPVVSLAPFGEEQIEAFNRAWYTRVMGPRRGWTATQCQQRADALTRTVLHLPHLRRLAESPLLLTLIAQVHSQGGTLPDNRADLYRRTVELLLHRWENRIVLETLSGEDVPEEEVLWLGVPAAQLQDVLAGLAYKGHLRQGEEAPAAEDGDAGGRAAEISRDELKLALVERFDSGEKAEQIMAYIQHRAGLLVAEEENVYTFPHRTFQEYLAARHLLNRANWSKLLRDHVREAPDWWREVFLLSAGIATVPDIILQLLNRLLPFGPGTADMPLTPDVATWVFIAAQALVETNFHYHAEQEIEPGSFTAVYRRVQEWLKAALVAEAVLPPKTRAEAGTWLAQVGDGRAGVGVDPETRLPDIVWGGEVPAGAYTIGDTQSDFDDEKPREVKISHPYRLACYPITNAQFQSFIDAPDRDAAEWWEDVPDDEKQFGEPEFPYANHPRERVSWYQALAFTRWLTAKLRAEQLPAAQLEGDPAEYAIALPHEYEWEVAARWPNEDVQQRIYPWGPDFDATKANTGEGDNVGQTTAVGMYPSGKNPTLDLYDLSGNVWEWCRNKYNDPEDTAVDGDTRVLRGGSFDNNRGNVRAAARFNLTLYERADGGFRVVVVRRPPSHHPDH